MTIDQIADKLKKNEIAEDTAYLKSVLAKEQKSEKEILYLLLVFWESKKNKRQLYKDIKAVVDDLFDTLEDELTEQFTERHREGYLEGAYMAQLLLGAFSNVSKVPTYSHKWHLNNGSFLDDLRYYKNRLYGNIRKEMERMLVLKAPVTVAVNEMKRPFKTLANSTKAMVETELVYAERQGLKTAYTDYGAKRYRYLATLDTLTCDRCTELDGRVFLLKDASVGANYPPMHPYCRCTTIPVFDDFADNGRIARDENGENIDVKMSYEEWKNRYGNWKKNGETVANDSESGTIELRNISQRGMANGLRTSPSHILDEKEIESIIDDAKDLNIPTDVLVFNIGSQTGFSDFENLIHIRGDILPDLASVNLRDILSQRAVLAHEYYGHYKSHPSRFRIGDWRDEFQASYKAAIDTPNLSDEDRRMLMLDAFDRAKEAGVPIKYNKKARLLIYGYD